MSDVQSSRVVKRAKYVATGIVAVLVVSAIVVLLLRSFHASALERAARKTVRRDHDAQNE